MAQLFVMLVGFSGSGRSTLAKDITENFPNRFTIIDVKDIHTFLNTTYPVLQDDNTIHGESFDLRQKISGDLELTLVKSFIESNKSIIYDASNLAREKRDKVIETVKKLNPEITIIIVNIQIGEELLLNELQSRDEAAVKNGLKAPWIELYEKVQKSKYEAPSADEADALIVYDRSNLEQVTKIISENLGE